jgi:digeranylgeranylglycerophospholipid reductase
VRDEYDIIVVGAGPSGSLAARTAARECDVLLLEKRQEIGAPVRCAEAVLKRALLEFTQPEQRWISSHIRGYKIFAPDGSTLEISAETFGIEGELAYILERKIFDRELAKSAARAGAQVKVRTPAKGVLIENGRVNGVKISSQGETFEVHAKVVIGADGIESQVGRWAGIDTALKLRDIGCGAQYLMADIDVTEDVCEIYLGSRAAGGYAWVFPKGNKLANVGVGMPASKLDNLRPINLLDEFVSRHFSDGKQLGLVMGAGPCSNELKTAVTNGLMLVGDAAHQCDPLSGGGITNAMESGQIAGEVAIKAVQKGDASVNILKEYEIRRRRSFFGKLQKHDYKIKEFVATLSDRDLDKLIRSLKGIKPQDMRVTNVAARLVTANPRILLLLRDLVCLKKLANSFMRENHYP